MAYLTAHATFLTQQHIRDCFDKNCWISKKKQKKHGKITSKRTKTFVG